MLADLRLTRERVLMLRAIVEYPQCDVTWRPGTLPGRG